jgi:hypothetical protein
LFLKHQKYKFSAGFTIFTLLKKVFYIFFAFYFLSLSVMPCSDSEDCNEAKHTEQLAQAPDHDHANETCTPFCVCSCCATHVVFSNVPSVFYVIAEIATVYTPQANADISSAVITIWQPPKLA